MPFYMNPFDMEFRAPMSIDDRKYSPTFVVPSNKAVGGYLYAWNEGPYDFSSVTDLTINYAIDPSMKAFASLTIDVSGATPAATEAAEVVDILNNNSAFAGLFTASLKTHVDRNRQVHTTIQIQPKRPAQSIRFYISNAGAEQKFRFNKKAGIAEAPSFLDRHLISNGQDPLSEGVLIKLDATDATVDLPIIREFLNDPTWTDADLKADYELLNGLSGKFVFKKQTVDSDDRITEIIEYAAGSVAGDVARKTTFSYTDSNKNPDVVAEVPYVLTNSDLVTPP